MRQIHKKINEIENGLLRFQDEERLVNLHIKAKCSDGNTIECFVTDNDNLKELINRKVSLVQKIDDNYLYTSGEISGINSGNKKSLSVRIIRACWFVLKSKGSVSWLQEKYICDIFPDRELEIA